MNTTIFWIVGGLIAVTAVVILVRRWLAAYRKEASIEAYQSYDPPVLAGEDMAAMDDEVEAVSQPDVILEDGPPLAMGVGETKGWEDAPADDGAEAAEEEVLRMDVAVPPRVEVGRAFDLAVALCQVNAPQLTEEDLTKVASGPVAVAWEDDAEKAVVRIQVIAPDCDIDASEQSVTLRRHQNEPPVYFLLTPQRTGRISIQVKVYQADLLLGNARVKTEAATEVGHVAVEVTSHPLALTPTDRRLLRQNLTDSYDLGELHGLIFALGLDKDNFPQEKDELIIDLIQTCLRQGLVRDLLAVGKAERPFLVWQLECIPE